MEQAEVTGAIGTEAIRRVIERAGGKRVWISRVYPFSDLEGRVTRFNNETVTLRMNRRRFVVANNYPYINVSYSTIRGVRIGQEALSVVR